MLICQYVVRSHVLAYSRTELQSRDSAYPSSHDLTSSIVSTSSCSSRRSRLSNWHTSITRSVTTTTQPTGTLTTPPSILLTTYPFILAHTAPIPIYAAPVPV